MTPPKGISVILCCYNSSQLLPETMKHLARLMQPDGYPVELIVIDNASTDNTSDIALAEWKKQGAPYPMHLHRENKAGLMFARKKGLDESKYSFILFVDDDNRPDENYLLEMVAVFEKYPNTAAVGGENEAVFEGSKPVWFHNFEHSYAVGRLADKFGEPDEIGLFGAGLCIRRQAYNQLTGQGFESRLVGRTGESLSSGEDYELCKALKIAGWDVIFSPNLKLKHYITRKRLNWEYLKKLNRGISRSLIWFLAYEYRIAKIRKPQNISTEIKFSWLYLLTKKTAKAGWLGLKILLQPKLRKEGSVAIIEYERTAIVIGDLLKNGKGFARFKRQIRSVRHHGIS